MEIFCHAHQFQVFSSILWLACLESEFLRDSRGSDSLASFKFAVNRTVTSIVKFLEHLDAVTRA